MSSIRDSPLVAAFKTLLISTTAVALDPRNDREKCRPSSTNSPSRSCRRR